jgi:hypothetical protein
VLLKENRASSEFWADLQVLHDSSVYWDDEGLTRRETESGGLLEVVSCCSAPRESEEILAKG